MYVTVTTTKGSPGQPPRDATLVGEAMLPWLEQIEGFEGLLMMTDGSEARTIVLSFWTSREAAERHREARVEFRDRITRTVDVRVESAADYELTFAALRSLPHVP
jgi:hypothetical protein